MKIKKLVKENIRDEYWYYAEVEIEGKGTAQFRFPAYYRYENIYKQYNTTEDEWLERQAASLLSNSGNVARAA